MARLPCVFHHEAKMLACNGIFAKPSVALPCGCTEGGSRKACMSRLQFVLYHIMPSYVNAHCPGRTCISFSSARAMNKKFIDLVKMLFTRQKRFAIMNSQRIRMVASRQNTRLPGSALLCRSCFGRKSLLSRSLCSVPASL